jgi:hypothetical protein
VNSLRRLMSGAPGWLWVPESLAAGIRKVWPVGEG